jgi:hypothetical protein
MLAALISCLDQARELGDILGALNGAGRSDAAA